MSARRPQLLYTAEQSRAVDRQAITVHGLPGPLLMARAARAAFDLLLAKQSAFGALPKMLQVLCGPGNNGGDGLLLAMLAKGRGITTRVFLVGGAPRSEDAIAAALRAENAGLIVENFAPDVLVDEGVVVDAMLGTGISGDVRPGYRAAIEALNSMSVPVLALDVPSGIDSDTGAVCGAAVRALWTVSFITAKRGLYTGAGAEHAGALSYDDLDVPEAAFSAADNAYQVLRREDALRALPERAPGAHKGHFGRCLIVGGDHGMGGAIVLAAEAALRTGVGLVRVATREAHLAAILARRPEAMVSAVDHRNALMPLLDWADTVIIGPGLGQEAWGEQMLHACLESAKPLLLDADALNLLATMGPRTLPAGSVITPHPGEAARLLAVEGMSSGDIQRDRFSAAEKLFRTWGATVVLKGNGSLVVGAQRKGLCVDGNPGMASGGMGDVLSGICGALLAQGLSAEDAAALAVVLHAQAGDSAAANIGERALLAGDLAPCLGSLLQ
ncbi:NAD(P)H-hydrate dehydratase [Congregibacter sp.]|uniref:NAD(P)H-hydrate dehydratase n=1 Tax=Congregibacter sp. TaxID=2744308 RepID=UPI003F6C3AD2